MLIASLHRVIGLEKSTDRLRWICNCIVGEVEVKRVLVEAKGLGSQ